MKQNPTSRSTFRRVSYLRAALVSVISVLITWALTAVSLLIDPVQSSYDPIPQEILDDILVWTMILATVIPILVSFPVAIILQRERIKLSLALEQLEEAHTELARTSRTDALTGLLNRGALMAAIRELQSEGRSGAMLMIDIDHFKTINDTYGHAAGDEALRRVATAIAEKARPTDLVGRLGGEEFAVFLPGCDGPTADSVAERIRQQISALRFTPRPGVDHLITASIGVAMGAPDGTIEDLFLRADRSLYAAKNSGRNRVISDTAA